MRMISAIDARQNLASLLDAAQRGPVMIRRQNRVTAVVLSPAEYDGLRGLNAADFQAFCDRVSRKAVTRGLTEEQLSALLTDDGPTARRR